MLIRLYCIYKYLREEDVLGGCRITIHVPKDKCLYTRVYINAKRVLFV